MHSQFTAITPTVEAVLGNLREAAFPGFQSHTESNESESYYYWGLGYEGVVDSYRHFHAVVEVGPIWSPDGELVGLSSSLFLPNHEDLVELGREFGVIFEGTGASMSARLNHAASKDALIRALHRLHQPDFMRRLLSRMRQYWGDWE
jgi:hypothetical protein